MATATTAAPSSSSDGVRTVWGPGGDIPPLPKKFSSCMERNLDIRDLVEVAKEKVKSARNSFSSHQINHVRPEWDDAISQMESLKDSLVELNDHFFLETKKSKPDIENCKNKWYECQEAYIKLSKCLTALEGSGLLTKEQLIDIRQPLSKQLIFLLFCLLLLTKTLDTCFPLFDRQGDIPNKVKVPSKEDGALGEANTAVSILGVAILLCQPIWRDSTQSCEDYANQALQTAREQDFQTAQEQARRAAIKEGKAVRRQDIGYLEEYEIDVDPQLMEQALEDLMSLGVTHADISPEYLSWLRNPMRAEGFKRSREQEAGPSTGTNGGDKKRPVLSEGGAPIYIYANEVSFFNGSSSSQNGRVDFRVQTTNVDETSRSEAEKQPQNLGAAHREDETNMNGGEAKDEAMQGHATGSGQGNGDKGQSDRPVIVVKEGAVATSNASVQPDSSRYFYTSGSSSYLGNNPSKGHIADSSTDMKETSPDGSSRARVGDSSGDESAKSSSDEYIKGITWGRRRVKSELSASARHVYELENQLAAQNEERKQLNQLYTDRPYTPVNLNTKPPAPALVKAQSVINRYKSLKGEEK